MITTKRGDKGKSYWQDKEVSKDSPLLEVIGTIDELISFLGIVKLKIEDDIFWPKIEEIQLELQIIATYLVGLGSVDEIRNGLTRIEKETDIWERELPKLTKFLIPGETESSAFVHFARSVARRLERKAVGLTKTQKVDELVLIYLNRLSDYLFMMARKINN